MAIKIFAALGDNKDDFQHVEQQVNTWIDSNKPTIISMHTDVTPMAVKRDVERFMLTLVVQYEKT